VDFEPVDARILDQRLSAQLPACRLAARKRPSCRSVVRHPAIHGPPRGPESRPPFSSLRYDGCSWTGGSVESGHDKAQGPASPKVACGDIPQWGRVGRPGTESSARHGAPLPGPNAERSLSSVTDAIHCGQGHPLRGARAIGQMPCRILLGVEVARRHTVHGHDDIKPSKGSTARRVSGSWFAARMRTFHFAPIAVARAAAATTWKQTFRWFSWCR
jgi:hypothetical protein